MASTAGDLAAQAEQLQRIMAFFRTGDTGDDTEVMGLRSQLEMPKQKTKVAHLPHEGRVHRSIAGTERAAKPMGVALDMGSGGKDDDDSEFERF